MKANIILFAVKSYFPNHRIPQLPKLLNPIHRVTRKWLFTRAAAILGQLS